MVSSFEQLHGIAGVLAFVKGAKNAAKKQKDFVSFFDPFQTKIDDLVNSFVQSFFKKDLLQEEPSDQKSFYSKTKERVSHFFFSTTESTLKWTKRIESSAEKLECFQDILMKQHSFLIRIEKICFTFFFLLIVPQWIQKPTKIVMVAGGCFSILHNPQAVKLLLKDIKQCAQLMYIFQHQPLKVRKKIKTGIKSIVDKAYPNVGEQKDTHSFHLANTVKYISEKVFGTKKEFITKLEKDVQTPLLKEIRTYEKQLRTNMFSIIADQVVKKVTTIVFSQLFRLWITNLTGLGCVAGFYWASHALIDAANDGCEWSTPLRYTWNHVIPFNQITTYPEICYRYDFLLTASDITKWTLRYVTLNKMIKSWELTHEQAFDEMIKPLRKMSKKKWADITTSFSETAKFARKKILSILKGVNPHETSKSSLFAPVHYPLYYKLDTAQIRRSYP